MERACSRQRGRRVAPHFWPGRVALAAPLVMATVTGAWPSCAGRDAAGDQADVDPGSTFGAEVTVEVVGRGRVTGRPGSVDCPSTCFARVVLGDPAVDGAEQGISLAAEASTGAHFTGWTLEALDLGMRARGPAECSPMVRPSVTAAPFAGHSSVISLPLGQTRGVPPRGHESACAGFTTVPLAYAVTATFEEDFRPRDAGPDTLPDAAAEVAFLPPLGAPSEAKEIGVAGGRVYWRFEVASGLSGIATGSSAGTAATVIALPDRFVSLFDVDRHLAYQRNGILYAVAAGATQPVVLGAAPTCVALASDVSNVYCRATVGLASAIYAWSVTGAAAPTLVHTLPIGSALAVDEPTSRFFVSDAPGSAGAATLASVPRAGDGGAAALTTLVVGQSAPRHLVVGSSRIFWVDARAASSFFATSGAKLGAGPGVVGYASNTMPFVAADPAFSSVYWVGIGGPATAGSRIVRLTVGGTSTVFRSSLTGLGGIAVDQSYVYWTQSDGRVYRAAKLDGEL